jgi:uncharacterized membrane protein YcaP (DUF421 family)
MPVIILRTVIAYLSVIASLRLMGKKQIGEMEPSELVVAIIISEIVAIPVVDPDVPILYGILPLVALVCFEIIISGLASNFDWFKVLVYGAPSRLIENGQINQKEIRRLRISVNELIKELRLAGFSSISEVNYCMIETNGRLSVIPFAKFKPATRLDMNLPAPESGITLTIIADGKVDSQNLAKTLKDQVWLEGVMKANGVSDASSVLYMGVDELDKVTLIKKQET